MVIDVAQGVTGMWWLYFRRGSKLVGVAIIEAPTLYHARTRVAVRGIGKAAEYSDAKKLDDGDAALVPCKLHRQAAFGRRGAAII